MPSRTAPTTLFAILALAIATSPASAQEWTLDLETSVRDGYEWRELRLDPGATFQYAGYGAATWTRAIWTAGVWSVTDLSSSSGGMPEDWFFEWSPWLEFAWGSERLRIRAGGVGYLVGDAPDETPLRRSDSWEVYVGAEAPVPSTPFTVRGTVYRDLDRVGGAYADLGGSLRVPVWIGRVVPVGSIFLDANTGWSLGMEDRGGEAADAFYFGERGLTHLDAAFRWTLLPIGVGGWDLSVTLEYHRVWAFDPETERPGWVPDGGVGSRRGWFGLGFRWTAPRCRPDRRLCRDL